MWNSEGTVDFRQLGCMMFRHPDDSALELKYALFRITTMNKGCRNIVVPKSPEFYFGTRQFGTCTKISDILIDAETSYIQVPKHLEIGTESKHLDAETS